MGDVLCYFVYHLQHICVVAVQKSFVGGVADHFFRQFSADLSLAFACTMTLFYHAVMQVGDTHKLNIL